MRDRVRIIFLSTGFTGVLLLSLLFYVYHPVINPDGFCYLAGAEGFSTLSLQDIIAICPHVKWPFYSLSIHLFDGFFSINNLERSAWILNALFSAGTWLAMMVLLRRLGASVRAEWIGGCVFLLLHEWLVVRQTIVRDHGYWLCYFLALIALCQFIQSPRRGWLFYVVFMISAACAVLFRIEAVFLLGVLPCSILFLHEWRWSERWRTIFFFYLPILVVGWLLLLASKIVSLHMETAGRLPELVERLTAWWQGSVTNYQHALHQYLELFPYADAHHFIFMWISELLSGYFIEIIKTSSVLFFIVFLLGYRAICSQVNRLVKTVLIFSLVLNFILNFLFFSKELFTVNRYLLAMVLTALIFIPLILDYWLTGWAKQHRRYRFGVSVVLIACVVQMVLSMWNGIKRIQEQRLLFQAATWLQQHHIPLRSVYSNDPRVFFYAYFAPHHYRAFIERSAFFQAPAVSLSSQNQYALLFYNHSGTAFLGTSPDIVTALSDWKIEYKMKDTRGRAVIAYQKQGTSK